MTSDRFWAAIGRELAAERDKLGWTWADVERQGGPSAPTVRENEQGKTRTTVALNRHAEALGVRLIDIFTLVVERQETKPKWNADENALVVDYREASGEHRVIIRGVVQMCRNGKQKGKVTR